MRKSTRIAATVASAGLIAAAMAAPASAARPDWSKKSDKSIVETAIAISTQGEREAGTFDNVPGDFDILVSALGATGAISVFNGTDYTVFAPTDQAFMDSLGTTSEQAAFDSAVSTFGKEGVFNILAYHVTEGVRNSKSVTGAKKITMLNQGTISARGGVILAANSTAGFLATDIRVSDGMIHVINKVLLP